MTSKKTESARQKVMRLISEMSDKQIMITFEACKIQAEDETKTPEECVMLARERSDAFSRIDPLSGFFFKLPNADKQRRAILSGRREAAGAVNLAGMWARPTGDINGVAPVSLAAEKQFIQVSIHLIHGSLLKNPS